MASLYKTGLAESNSGFVGPGGGVVYVREATYAITGAMVVDDVIQMVPVAKGERLVDLQVVLEDFDTGTALVVDVGDGDDVDRYVDGSTIGQTGGLVRLGQGIATDAAAIAVSRLYTAADTIDVYIAVAPGTPVTTGTVRLRAFLVRG